MSARSCLADFGSRLDSVPNNTPGHAYLGVDMTHAEGRAVRDAIDTILATQPATSQEADGQQSDDLAVDAFAARMKAKLAAARARGQSGWDDPAQCSVETLQTMLYDHLAKGDPVDVANFCMMLGHYGATTANPP